MGLESYLFYIEFKPSIKEESLNEILLEAGMTKTKSEGQTLSDFRSYYYEIKSDSGITEVHSLFSPDKISTNYFSLRFSIASPQKVIQQTFNFLNSLNKLHPIKVKDSEIINHIYRELRQEGKVDIQFKGLSEKEREDIEEKAYIPIDIEKFIKNDWKIYKRKLVIDDNGGKDSVRGGVETFNHIEKKNVFEKFFGWIKKEI